MDQLDQLCETIRPRVNKSLDILCHLPTELVISFAQRRDAAHYYGNDEEFAVGCGGLGCRWAFEEDSDFRAEVNHFRCFERQEYFFQLG